MLFTLRTYLRIPHPKIARDHGEPRRLPRSLPRLQNPSHQTLQRKLHQMYHMPHDLPDTTLPLHLY